MIGFGDLNIKDIRLGSTIVKKVYLGDKLVYGTSYPKPPYPEGLPIYEVKTAADWDDSKYPQESFVLLVSGNVDVPMDTLAENQYVQYVDIENGSSIGNGSLSSCPNLKTVYIGNTVQQIEGSTFDDCQNLEEVVIGDGVTSISDISFAYCFSLKSLIIGKGVEYIGTSAFGNCYNLKCIYFYGDDEPSININAFYNVAVQVMVKPSYKGKQFGNLDVTTSTVDGCPVM